MLGQASGGFTESSSALRLLHVGIRNTNAILTDDAFTQTNPPIVTTSAPPLTTISSNVDTAVLGVLSGSVAFTRPDEGSNYVGGPNEPGAGLLNALCTKPVGLFINNAVGNAYENTPGPASGLGPYVSAMGTYASQLFETQAPAAAGAYAQYADLVYTSGMSLMASRNGYLIPAQDSAGATLAATASFSSEVTNGAASATTIAILRMPADSTQPEIVFDQRI
jgi:hypothetical protein